MAPVSAEKSLFLKGWGMSGGVSIFGLTTFDEVVNCVTGDGIVDALSAMDNAHFRAAVQSIQQVRQQPHRYDLAVKDVIAHLQIAHSDLQRTWKSLDSFVMKSILRYTALYAIHNDRYTCFVLGYCYVYLKDALNARACVDFLNQTDSVVSSLENRFSIPFAMFLDPTFYGIFRGKAPMMVSGQNVISLAQCMKTIPR